MKVLVLFFCTVVLRLAHAQGPSPSLDDIRISQRDAKNFFKKERRLEWGDSENCPPGKWWEEYWAGDECHDCSAGKYQDAWATQRNCKVCGPGTYQGSNGQGHCNGCPAGQYQNQNQQRGCKHCPNGFYQDQNVQNGCKACPSGFQQPYTLGQECVQCPPGWYQSGLFCFPCGFSDAQFDYSTGRVLGTIVGGTYQDIAGQTTCKTCPAGTYQVLHSQAACTRCPAGYSNPTAGKGSSDSCIACSRGLFSLEASLSCAACPAGFGNPGSGESKCIQCSPGFYQEATGQYVACKGCEAGKYQNDYAQNTCLDCEIGKFQAATSQKTCLLCPVGKYIDAQGKLTCLDCQAGRSSATGTSDSECTKCAIGYYLPPENIGRACLHCPGSTDLGAETCAGCPAGKAENDANPPTCESCVPGKYAEGGGTKTCLNCPSGYYQEQSMSEGCIACVPGKWSSTFPSSTISDCKDCPVGKFGIAAATIQEASCTDCTPGYFSSSSGQNHISNCQACLPGKFATDYGRSVDCEICVVGKYSGNAAATSQCMSCPGGWYQESTAQSTCKACLPGKRQPNTQQNACLNCAAGRYSLAIEAITCEDCDAGFYQAKKGQILCFPCMVGRAQESQGMQRCGVCEEGKYRGDSDAPNGTCVQCPTGWSQGTLGAVGCTACSSGTYTSQMSSHDCLTCSAGMYTPDSGSLACSECSVGQWTETKEGASSCTNCPTGRSGGHCRECQRGKFRGSRDDSSLWPCPSCPTGWSQPANGSSLCLKCIPGKYAEHQGQVECVNCPNGWLQGEQSGTLCNRPPPGSIAGQGGSSTVSVALGWHINPLLSPPMEECPPGTIGSDPPSEMCINCPPGTDSEKASMICHTCEIGKYAPEPRTQSCILCDRSMREYTDTTGQQSCKTCPTGKQSKSYPDGCENRINPKLPRPDQVRILSISNATDEEKRMEEKRSMGMITAVDPSSFVTSVLWDTPVGNHYDSVKTYEISISTHGDFDSTSNNNSTNRNRNKHYHAITAHCEDVSDSSSSSNTLLCMFSKVETDVALWRRILYAQVRAIGKDDIPGPWSLTSKTWKVASDCSNKTDDAQYLSVGKSGGTNPAEYNCRSCPVGGSCEGAVIAGDVVAMFGWWECSLTVPLPDTTTTIVKTTNVDSRQSSIQHTTAQDGDSEAASFSLCGTIEACLGASNSLLFDSGYVDSDGNDLAKAGGPDRWTNGSRCADGYRNPAKTNRRCTDCSEGYVRTGQFGTCSKCPSGVAIMLVPVAVIVASLLFIALLVALKVRSTGSKRAPHTVLRRTLLHHLQTLAIILSLNVQWPEYLREALSFLSAVVSTNDHMSIIKCYRVVADQMDETKDTFMGKEATFFYTMLIIFLLLPGILSLCGYIYWVGIAPHHAYFRCGVTLHPREARKKRKMAQERLADDGIELVENPAPRRSLESAVAVALPHGQRSATLDSVVSTLSVTSSTFCVIFFSPCNSDA